MGARGESTITLENREVAVLFTNRALAEAEQTMGKPVLGLIREFSSNGALGFMDLAQLLRAGMEAARRDAHAGGKMVTLNEAYAVMDEVGFTGVAVPVVEAITAVVSYSQEREEAEPDPN